jgi:hypothetical protein
MERSDVAGHQSSGECVYEDQSEGTHVFPPSLDRRCFGTRAPRFGAQALLISAVPALPKIARTTQAKQI